jgi:antitoxin component of MazEF toxin-antitoxin module
MTITSTQKVIKVGSSLAVTIPAKDVKRLGVKQGDELEITAKTVKKPQKNTDALQKEYETFVAQYGETLKNLKNR